MITLNIDKDFSRLGFISELEKNKFVITDIDDNVLGVEKNKIPVWVHFENELVTIKHDATYYPRVGFDALRLRKVLENAKIIENEILQIIDIKYNAINPKMIDHARKELLRYLYFVLACFAIAMGCAAWALFLR